MKRFNIDRFEDRTAVLVDEEKRTFLVSCECLPKGSAEGDVLLFDGKNYISDPIATAEKKAEVKSLIDELFQ